MPFCVSGHPKLEAKEKYKDKKQKTKEKNDLDQILYMMERCRKEMSQFRKHCCSVCHRMFRKKGVVFLTGALKQSFIDINEELANRCFSYKPKIFEENPECICHTCHRNMKNNKLPRFAIANGLELKPLPKELSNLCSLEKQLIAQGYRGVKGESVYVPIEPTRVAKTLKTLPRKLTDAELIPLKLKRR